MTDNPGINLYQVPPGAKDTTFFRRNGVTINITPPVKGFHDHPHQELTKEGSPGITREWPTIVKGVNDSDGILITGFYDLFWKNRIHVVPTRRALGNIITPVQTSYELYNAYEFTPKTLTTKAITSLDGITFTVGPDPVPPNQVIGAKESLPYTIVVSNNGQPNLNGSIDHTFLTGEVLKLYVTGSRVFLFPFSPQGGGSSGGGGNGVGINEQWEWFTNVIQAANGSEQRIALRHLPRQSYVYSFMSGDELANAKFENFMRSSSTGIVALPNLLDGAVLTSAVVAGGLTLPVDTTTNRDFRSDSRQGYAMIYVDDNTVESVGVSSFDATNLYLTAPIIGSYPAGTVVYPLRLTHLQDMMRQTLYKVNVRKWDLQFDVLEGRDYGDETGFTTFNGTPIFTDVPQLFDDTYNRTFNWQLIETGSKASRFARRSTRLYPKVEGFRFLMTWGDQAGFLRARRWLNARRGMQKAFWMRSHRYDLQIYSDNGVGTGLIVKQAGYSNMFSKGMYINLAIEYVNGVIDYRTVFSAADGGAFETITLTATSTQALSAANVAKISLLVKFRLDSDSLLFRHDYQWSGSVEVPVVEVIN